MKLAIGALALVAAMSGCTSSGLPMLGATQRYAYPVERQELPPATASASRRVAAAPSHAAPGDSVGAADQAPYDEAKDPSVTAVLLPPVKEGDFLEDRIGPDGKQIILATPARIAVIDVSENAKALAAANP